MSGLDPDRFGQREPRAVQRRRDEHVEVANRAPEQGVADRSPDDVGGHVRAARMPSWRSYGMSAARDGLQVPDFLRGEMAERLKAAVLKTDRRVDASRGFESRSVPKLGRSKFEMNLATSLAAGTS